MLQSLQTSCQFWTFAKRLKGKGKAAFPEFLRLAEKKTEGIKLQPIAAGEGKRESCTRH
jgi:hypothetical protein